ncbi:hypothetical protein LUZ60_004079 [Juncus effusus]|nr:hypothetical protein LUZ60_004079 [Juncus effusus]
MKRLFDQSIITNSNNIDMAKMLIFLSHDKSNEHIVSYPQSQRVFECKTCNRQFPSFQALGGHRASHKKPRLAGPDGTPIKPKLHECSICGLEFSIGQALGGHMRRHRPINVANSLAVKKDEEKKTNFTWFDLNQPAEEGEELEMECRNAIGHTFDFMGVGSIAVDCFQ